MCIAPSRLREIANGAVASGAEREVVDFAVLAGELEHAARIAKFERIKRDCLYCAVVTVVGLVMLGFLLSVAVLMLSMASHTTPFSP